MVFQTFLNYNQCSCIQFITKEQVKLISFIWEGVDFTLGIRYIPLMSYAMTSSRSFLTHLILSHNPVGPWLASLKTILNQEIVMLISFLAYFAGRNKYCKWKHRKHKNVSVFQEVCLYRKYFRRRYNHLTCYSKQIHVFVTPPPNCLIQRWMSHLIFPYSAIPIPIYEQNDDHLLGRIHLLTWKCRTSPQCV